MSWVSVLILCVAGLVAVALIGLVVVLSIAVGEMVKAKTVEVKRELEKERAARASMN